MGTLNPRVVPPESSGDQGPATSKQRTKLIAAAGAGADSVKREANVLAGRKSGERRTEQTDKHRHRQPLPCGRSRSRGRSQSRDRRGRHARQRRVDGRRHLSRSQSRSRLAEAHRHTHRGRSRSRSREGRSPLRHRARSQSKGHKALELDRMRDAVTSPQRQPQLPAELAAVSSPAEISAAGRAQRNDSGKGHVIKLRIHPPLQLPVSGTLGDAAAAVPVSPHRRPQHQEEQQMDEGHEDKRRLGSASTIPANGGLAGRLASSSTNKSLLSFGDELEELGGALPQSPLPAALLATVKPSMHEKTLVTLQAGPSPSSHRLLPSSIAEVAFRPLPATRALGPLLFGTASDQGMRPYQEDRHTVIDTFLPRSALGHDMRDGVLRSFAAIYDGHNGTLAADMAADTLHHILAAEPALRTCTGEGPPAVVAREEERMAAALTHAFEATDRDILTRCRREKAKGGATGVAILRIGDILYAAHCGDSRAVMCRGGEPLRLTEDHKPNVPRERMRVEALGGRVDWARCWRVIVDPGDGRPASGLAVSRSFGDPDFKEPLHLVTATPDVMRERLEPEDAFVVLASDGLWDVLSDKQAVQLVIDHIEVSSKGGSVLTQSLAASAARLLVHASLDAGSLDNVTALVALMPWRISSADDI